MKDIGGMLCSVVVFSHIYPRQYKGRLFGYDLTSLAECVCLLWSSLSWCVNMHGFIIGKTEASSIQHKAVPSNQEIRTEAGHSTLAWFLKIIPWNFVLSSLRKLLQSRFIWAQN